ncbi:hypothetical protein F511_27997 [Dorcoceras hygrometricum]|uniref:Dystroglycan-like n=1 Tax=Dorcoceras hygrometricum TaxID=472368 RepID=A0A2Z7BWJ1_9LAMI|nr:hypothetical protein F511_27997 [Dorcoceras hygrometricum]
MASSLIRSSHHVDFESVFGFDDAGMVQMFETIITTGLKNFLGCPAVFYEAVLTEFFSNGSVRDGLVVSTVNGVTVEISEKVFAAAFGLPIDGLKDLSDVPKNLVFDARSLFYASKEQVSISCFKKEMKIEYRLLHDILVKTLFVKVGSFDAVTQERFMLMTAITFDVKVNWINLLFGVLKAMVTPGSRQAKGFAIQIGVILQKVPGLDLGDSRPFPTSRVLTEKTVHRFVNINEQVGMDNTTASPRVKKMKKAVSKKRQVGVAEMPAEQPSKPKRRTQKRKRRLVLDDADETGDIEPEQPAAEIAAGAQVPIVDDPVATQPDIVPTVEATTDDPVAMIEKILNQLDTVAGTDGGDQPAAPATESTYWFDLPFILARREAEGLLSSDTDEDLEKIFTEIDTAGTTDGTVSIEQTLDDSDVESLAEIDLSSSDAPTVYRSPSQILQEVDSFEHNLQFALGPAIFSGGAQEELPYFVESPESPSPISPRQESSSSSTDVSMHFDKDDILLDDNANVQPTLSDFPADISPFFDDLKTYLSQRMDTANSDILSRLHTVERGSPLPPTSGVSSSGQANHNILHAHLSELVAYINQGGDNKNGESSSSRGPQPPPPPVDQIRGTGVNVSTPDFAQRFEVAQRNIMERVMDTDRRKSLLEAERDRERRRSELSGSKRRRKH